MSDIKRAITPNEPADFTPEMGNYKTLQPFRYWCQKVLPLVYDDSLSYYELLCKVVDYLNKTMEDVEVLHGDVTNLHEAYEELQGYVNNYFSTLDVQEEINNKLDVMAKDGTLSSIMVKFAKPYPIFVNSIGEMTNHELNYVLTTDGYIYYYNGSSFVSSGIHYGTNTLYLKSYGNNFYYANPSVTDLNSAPLNTVLVFTFDSLQGSGVANVPTSLDFKSGFNVFTYGAEENALAGSVQVAVSFNEGNVAYRAYAGTWTEWRYLTSFYMKGYGTNFNDANPPVTDLNSAPLNTALVFTFDSLQSSGVANVPTSLDFKSGFNVFTYGAEENALAGSVQVAVSFNEGNVAYRAYAGTWTEWRYLTGFYMKGYGINFNEANPPVTDLNSAPLNTVLVFTLASLEGSGVANAPTSLDFTSGFNVFTYGADVINLAGSVQVAVSLNEGNVAYRAYAGTWTEWRYLTGFYMKGYGINFNEANPPVTDLNSAPLNTVLVFTLASLEGSGVANAPTSLDFTSGFNVFTYGADVINLAGSVQVAVSLNEGNVAYRVYAGTWTEWRYFYENNTIHATPNDDFNSKVIEAYNAGATLILEAGTYDIDYSNPYGTGRYRGLPIGNGCEIIGNGTVNINLNYTGGDAEFSQNLSAFNVYGECKLKNVNINVNNILYCVHDDAAILNKHGFTVEYENVNMSCNGVLGGGGNISTCIGGGVQTNDLRIISGGTFKTNAYTAPITYHNGDNGKSSTILIKGAYVDGDIRLYDFVPTADVLNAYISNSKFSKIQYEGEEDRFNTILFNNETN